MNTALPILLVLLLSGIPATAVVCDLLLCADPQAAADVAGCHEHGNRPADDVMSPATGGCTHLADASPFVAPALRVGFDVPVAVLASGAAPRSNGPVALPSRLVRHAPPPLPRPLALRI